MGTELRIVLQLPQELGTVADLLLHISNDFPNSRIDNSTPGGWTVIIPPLEESVA